MTAGESLLFDAAIGLGVLAYLIFLLGLLGLLRFPFLLGLLAVAALISWFSLVTIVGEICQAVQRRQPPSSPPLERGDTGGSSPAQRAIVGGLISIIAILALIGALAPPTMGDWDGLAYHLAVPKLYLERGGIFYIPFTSHSNFPFTVEMLYTLGLGLGSVGLAKLFNFAFGALAVGAVYLTTRRHFGARFAPLAALLFAGMPIVAWEATVAYHDLAVGLYTILAAATILGYADSKDAKWLALGAISIGLAAGTKMTALASVALFAAWAGLEVWGSHRKAGGAAARAAIRQALVFGVIALAIASPWYIKSYVHTGNPVYPFFYDTFGGRNWSGEIAAEYRRLQQEFGMGQGIADFVRVPWDLAFHSERFYDRPGLHIGPALLAMLPLMILAMPRDRRLLKLGALSLTFLLTWFLMTQQSRYLLPAFGIAAISAAGSLSVLPRPRFARILAIVAASVTAILSILILRELALDSGRVVMGSERPQSYLTRSLDTYSATSFVNLNNPPGSKVILYGETRGFYLDRDYLWGDPGHSTLIPYDNFEDESELMEHLRSMGVTHALVNFRYFPRAGPCPQLVYAAIEADLFEEVYRDDVHPVAVYRLRQGQ